MAEGNALECFFNPASIAVVGASPKKGKISRVIIENLKAAGFKGEVYPVNPSHNEVLGLECHPSVKSIGEDVDLAVVATPADTVPGILREASGALKGAVVVGGGFGETGEKGEALEKELKQAARETGIRVMGPNCMGVFDNISRVDTFFIPTERVKRPKLGGVAVVSQSGSFALSAIDELASEGVGVSRVVSYGNRADVNEADCLEFLARDASTTAVALYVESVADGRRFVEAARRCSEKKPVMALKVGRLGAGAQAARSHTGAIAGRYEVYRAAFRKAGVVELRGYDEFLAGCKAFGMQKAARGKRVAIITDGGGIGVGLADACSELGLDVAELPPGVADELRAVFPEFFTVANPMDLTGSATDELFAESLEKAMAGDHYDMAVVAALWGPPGITDRLAELLSDKASSAGKPVVICTPGGEYTRGKMELFRKRGLPVFSTPETAARAAYVLSGGSW